MLNDVYFKTGAGEFSVDYIAWDGSEWGRDYEITVKPGAGPRSPGADSWFVIGLLSHGPEWDEYDYARTMEEKQANGENGATRVEPILKSDKSLREGKVLSEVLKTEVQETPYGTMTIKYRRILDK